MHIKPLTSLRFVFALMVFCSHLTFLQESTSTTSNWIYNHIFYEGYIGVSFFFVLSGFILCYVYQEKFLNKTVTSKQFYLARLARIYPLHVVTLIIAIPLEFWGNPVEWSRIATGFLQLGMVHSLVPVEDVYFSYNGPSWSIATEAFFYVFFPAIIYFVKINNRKMQCILFLFMVIAVPIFMNIVPTAWQNPIFYISPLGRIVDFIIGIALYQLIKTRPLSFLKSKYSEFVVVGIFIVFFAGHFWIPFNYRYSVYYWLPICLIITVFFYQRGSISKILSCKPALWLGNVSFGFYMIHQLVYRYLVYGNATVKWVSNDLVVCLIVFIVSLLLAGYSYRYLETPMNRWIRQRC